MSEDAYSENTEEPRNNTFADTVQPPIMVQNPYFFSNDLEDDLNEIISPVNSCSKSCKAVNSVYNPFPLLTHPTIIGGYDKLTLNAKSNVEDANSQARSQKTCPNDVRTNDGANITFSFKLGVLIAPFSMNMNNKPIFFELANNVHNV